MLSVKFLILLLLLILYESVIHSEIHNSNGDLYFTATTMAQCLFYKVLYSIKQNKSVKEVFRNVFQPAAICLQIRNNCVHLYNMCKMLVQWCKVFLQSDSYFHYTPHTCKYQHPHIVHQAHAFKYKLESTRWSANLRQR